MMILELAVALVVLALIGYAVWILRYAGVM